MVERPMRIVVTGGGSGGHITPLLAVADAIKAERPDCEIIYVGQKGDSLADIPARHAAIDAAYTVRAGKFRRYHGEGLKQLLDLPTMAKNGRDAAYVAAGIAQCLRLLKRLQPDVVFVKGGYVGVPVGLAAAKLGIPYITHDSDALPGLANRIIARWAQLHTVALPKDVYAYPADKTVTVGVPIAKEFRRYTVNEQAAIRQRLALPKKSRVMLVVGGGNGAQRLNDAVIANADRLLNDYPDLRILHQAGRALQADVSEKYNTTLDAGQASRVQVYGFTTAMHELAAAADVVVTRAGATNMAEFAALAKPCVIVPNPQLTGGHQLKNAQAWAEHQAAVVLDEPTLTAHPNSLYEHLKLLLDEPQRAAAMGERLHSLAVPDAARKLAVLLLVEADKRHRS